MSQQAQLAVQTQQKATDISSIKGNMLQRAAINTSITPVHSGVLQRCSGGVECAACRLKRLEKEGTLQRAAVNSAPTNAVPPIVHDVLSSSGQPLDAATRAFMEPRFGRDFSGVRVHTDARAADSARAVNALAYTVGRDVVFGAGQYMPGTMEGMRLMAHELTHVVQQASMISMSGGIGSRSDPHEREAERVASIVSRGQSTNVKPAASSPLLQCQEEEFRLPEPTFGRSQRRQPSLFGPGEELQLPPPTLDVGERTRRFAAEGVNVVVRQSCASTKKFGFDLVEEATRNALDKIFSSDCISADRRARIQKNLTQHGLDIRCAESSATSSIGDVCAEATGYDIPANIMTLGSSSFSNRPDSDQSCLPLKSTILHEIVHLTRGVFEEALPGSCESSCFGTPRGTPDLCQSPIVRGG